jgi:hypothetical protein
MRVSKDYGTAHKKFSEANDIHILVYRRPSPEALYYMACCLSLGASRIIESKGTDMVANLPPMGIFQPGLLAEKRLDHAISTLNKALDAGYSNGSALLLGDELKYLRDMRPAQVAALAQRAQANANTQMGLPKGGSLPMSVPSLQTNAVAQARLMKPETWPQGVTSSTNATMATPLRAVSVGSSHNGILVGRQTSSTSGSFALSSQPPPLGIQAAPNRGISSDSHDGSLRCHAPVAGTMAPRPAAAPPIMAAATRTSRH